MFLSVCYHSLVSLRVIRLATLNISEHFTIIAVTQPLSHFRFPRYNRLGLDDAKVSFLSNHVEKVLVPTRVRAVKNPIVDVAMGPNHTVCLTDMGKLISFGRNSEAQLGRGHARSVTGPDFVKAMQNKEVTMVSCGATFTVVGTNENVIYFWGTRFISPMTRPNTRDAFNQSFGARLASPNGQPLSDAEVRLMVQRERERGEDGMHESGLVIEDKLDRFDERTLATLSSTELLKHQGEITMKDVVLQPQEILALYASATQQEKGETVMLGNIQSQNQNIFLVVETTCPLARTSRPQSVEQMKKEQPNVVVDMAEFDTDENNASVIPDWLQNELDEGRPPSKQPPGRFPRPPTRGMPRADQPGNRESTAVRNEYKNKLEVEFNKKQLEIRMEAQNAVREREKVLNDEVARLREELERQKMSQQELLEAKAKEAEKEEKEKACSIQ